MSLVGMNGSATASPSARDRAATGRPRSSAISVAPDGGGAESSSASPFNEVRSAVVARRTTNGPVCA
jgi:hypothetical protein